VKYFFKIISFFLFSLFVCEITNAQTVVFDMHTSATNNTICRNEPITIFMTPTQNIRYVFELSTDGINWVSYTGNFYSDAQAYVEVSQPGITSLIANTQIRVRYTTNFSSNSLPDISDPTTLTVIVNQLPAQPSISASSYVTCQNSDITFSSTTPSGIFTTTWTSSNFNSATVGSTGLVHGVSQGTSIITYSITDANGCQSKDAKPVTVNPTPIISSFIDAVCSGVPYSVIPNGSNVSGATFNWGMPSSNAQNVGDLTGMATAVTSTQQNVNAVLTNNTNSVIAATYTITATKGACSSVPFNLTLSVTPKPYIADRVYAACSGAPITDAPTNGGGVGAHDIVPVGITYSWAIPSVPTGITNQASSGASSPTTFSGLLRNSTNGMLSVTYLVSTYNAGCTGSTYSETVNVNPTPRIVAQSTTICSNSSFSVPISDGGSNLVPVGTRYSWAAPGVGGINGLQSGNNAAIISGTLSNTTNSPISNITYVVTPTAGACNGPTFNVSVTVNPVPIISDLGPTQTGSGSTFNFTITGSIVPVGTTYTWAIPTQQAGLTGGAASGFPSPTSLTGTLTNPTGNFLDALYTITPTYLNCTGSAFAYIVRVYPKPIIGNKTLAPICSGQSFPPVVLTDGVGGDVVPSGTTYSWNAPVVAGITGTATGTAAGVISGTLTNIYNYPIVVTYVVTPFANPQSGDPFNITITVNPLPLSTIVINENSGLQSNDQIICRNGSATFSAVPVVGLLTDYNYAWVVPVSAAAPGNVPSFSSSKAGTYSLSITNKTTGCVSAVQTSTSLTVINIPIVGSLTSSANTVCVGASLQLNTTGDNAGAAPYIYNWSYPTIASGSATTNTSTVNLSGGSAGNGDITYTLLDQNGCYSNRSAPLNITVYANPLQPIVTPINVVYDGLAHTVIANPAAAPVGTDIVEWYSASSGGVVVTPTPSITNVGTITKWAQAKNNTTGCVNINRASATVTITQKGLVITANDYQKQYDRIVYSGGNGVTYTDPVTGTGPGFVNGETASVLAGTLTYGGTSQNKINAGSYTIIPGGLTSSNYNISFVAGALTITKKVISISGASVQDKIYDATDVANLSGGSLSGLILADLPNVTLNRLAKFSSKNVGSNLVITSTSTLSGSAALNYTLDQTINVTASIIAKHLNVMGVNTADKIYDGTNVADVSGGSFITAIAPGTGTSSDKTPYVNDNIQLAPSGFFAAKNVGNNIVITSTSTITGTDKDNYILDQPSLTAKNITPKTLKMTGLVVSAPKIYDATTVAFVSGTAALFTSETAGTGSVMDGKPYTDDIVSIIGTPIGTFNAKDVATANSVSFSGLSLTGTNAGNYSLVIQSAVGSSILPKNITMYGLSVPASKGYDGNTNSVVNGTAQLQTSENPNTGNTNDGKPYTGDDVSITGTPIGNYNSKTVSQASYVIFTGLSLTGAQASNYTFTIQGNAASIITPQNINVVADAQTKTYGNSDPVFTYVNDPLVAGDSFTGVLTRITGEKVGAYQINLGSLSLGTNYTITYVPNNLTITKASLTVLPDVINRIYGDTSLPTIITTGNFKVIGLQNGEVINTITLTLPTGPGSGNDASDGAGNYIGVAKAGLPITGTIDLANYQIVFYNADIIVGKYPITITADPKQKRKSQFDPVFTYQVSRPLVNGAVITGSLTRAPGEEVGFYTILQGDLAINDNYDINYLSADLEILTIERVLVIPTAFTPNNDGLNDMLKVMHNSTIVSINYLKIFNRAGNQIFDTKDINQGWDGKVNGSVADADAYYWILEYNTWDNKVFKVKGSTLLVK
jgi:gliding motility-associated-like protein